jgi:hypothetical protein
MKVTVHESTERKKAKFGLNINETNEVNKANKARKLGQT